MTKDSLPPAGWHTDPTNTDQLRYWDGGAWTSHTHPTADSAATSGAVPSTPPEQPTSANRSGFFSSLFDMSMKPHRTVTVDFARFLYIFISVAAVLGWLGISGALILLGYSEDTPEAVSLGFILLVIGWLVPLFISVATRVILEFMIANVRTALNTAILVDLAGVQTDK